MATTINIVNALYKEAISDVTKDAEHWQSFLKTASMNYTNEFDEQLLIYYQRPEAVACATINDWNNKFKRLVNEGCPGIGLKTYYGTKPAIKYVWGLNDTHNMYNSRNNLKLWQIPKKYEEDVILLLEEKFGTINNKSNYASSIKDLAFNLVDDNISDYLDDLVDNKENTLLESISNDIIENKYRELAVNSIAYMIINRSGVDPTPYFDNIDFESISMFQDLSSLARIGAFISNTSKTGLSEMYLAIKNVQIAEKNKIRTFANINNIVYDVGENERRDAYESNLREESRLSNSEYISRGGGNSHDEQIRSNVASTLERTQEWDLSRNEDDRNSNEELKRNRSNISSEGIADNQTVDIREQHNGRNESNRPDEVGRSYEQYQSDSRGNDNERVDIQLEEYIRTDNTYSPYVVVDEKVNQIITKAPNLKDININIAKYFKETDNKEERASYIKSLFKVNANDIEIDGIIYNLKSFKNGVLFWKEDFDTRDTESFITYEKLVDHYDAMILLKQIDIANNLYEQNTLFDNEESKVENRPDIQITYEFVDKYLQSENKEFKFQIYKQFTAMNSKQDDIEYIKNRYGLSGSSYTIRGAGIGYSADAKGIEFNRGYLAPSTVKQFFSWSNIADRIRKLIREGNYLTSTEEKEYQQWLSIEDKKDEFIVETITPISELDDERAFTVARVMNYDYCVELHYSKGKANVEVMTRTSPDSWHGIVEDIDWLNKDLTDKYVLNKLEDIFNDNFPDADKSDLNNYYGEYNDEIDLIDHILHIHKIDDIKLSFDDDSNLVAKDDDNVWYGKEFYDFLFDELFVYNEDDEVDLIDKEDLRRLKEYRKKYDIPTEKEIENSEINQVSQLSLFDDVEQKINDDGILNIVIDNKEDTIIKKPKRKKISNDILHPDIPYEERINYKIIENELGVGTKNERFRNNINAIKVLKQCEEEDRYATSEEQEILSKYVGWGGLADAFDEEKWKSAYDELKELLNEEEYRHAKNTVTTAFYTPPIVIRAMYKALSNMGLEKGNILEPSCGIGNFIGMLPNNDKLKIYGVEIDDLSGRIAKQLYQRSSIAIKGFEKIDYSDSFFDVAIGNVPFGNEKVYDKKYDKYNFMIHDYFFAKTIDKVRPGGVIAFVTSRGTLDKESNEVRKYIAQRADFLGAIRLPNDTFKRSAGTEITSDIIFLQKRDSITDIMPDWVSLDTTSDDITMNKYYVDNPNMVLGKMEMQSNQYGGYSPVCVPYENSNLEELLNNAINNINAKITEYQIDDLEEDISIEADLNVRNFSYTLIDDKLYYRENSRMYPQELSDTAEKRIKGLIELRDITREIIDLQLNDYSDEKIEDAQIRLNECYDKFTKKYGLINSRGNSMAFSDDSSYFLLCSLEILDDNGELLRKADMFTKKTIKPHTKDRVVNNARDALIVSLSDKARVDLTYMHELCKIDMDKMLEDLSGEIFRVPEYGNPNNWVTADEYLSGNVREKLKTAIEFAKEDSNYQVNVDYLKTVIPKDIPASEINVRLGATWIPEDIITQFMFELLDSSYIARENMKVHYSNLTGEWNIENKYYDKRSVAVESTYGTNRANAYRLLEDALNLRDTKIFDYQIDDKGNKVAILNKKETAIAQAKQDKIRTSFTNWIWSDIERRDRLTLIYNERFNAIRTREYDGSHITFDGINPEIQLRKHQVNAVARILYGGNTLLAHEVGAGKTFVMVAAAMESKRLGLCNKSLFVVPNHIIEQFASEFLQLYPSANILVATKKDFEKNNRKKFCSKIATGDYDAVIIGHSQFEKIPMSEERQRRLLEQQLEEISQGIEDLKNHNGERFSIKALVRTQKAIQNKLNKMNDTEKKDNVVTFEELGVDRIFVDEAHYYKNLYLYTKMRNIGGIAQTEAQKSSDLYMKCRYLDELTGNKGIIFATGTPVSNTMAELYTMQRYLQYDTLLANKLQHFDAWASTFGETVTAMELAPEGTGYRSKTRFAKFYNLPELMTMFKEVADIQTADMLNLPVPKANYENIVINPSDLQLELVKSFSERAEKIRNREVDAHVDNMLKITNDGRKLSLDQRLINESLPEYENGKIEVSASNIYRIWEETKENKLTQLVFCDLSTPKGDGSFNVYDDMKRKLIEKGIPENEIEFIHDANTETRKKELFSKVRSGQVRVLMGSTQKMGAGTNRQDKLIALHDLDCPWRPADLTQRSGRIVRQGNQNDEVFIYRYVTEKTFDAYSYQTVEHKQKFISQVMTSKTPVRAMEDIDEVALSYAEIKALAAGNPLIIEKTELDTQVSQLKLLKQSYLSEQYDLESKVKRFYPKEIERLTQLIANYEKDLDSLKKYDNDENFKMVINDVTYLDKESAGTILLKQRSASTELVDIGEYKEFKMSIKFDAFFKEYKLFLTNNVTYSVELGDSITGNITRIDNVLKNIDKNLEDAKNELENSKIQLEKAKNELGKPFIQEEELDAKIKRLNEVNSLLKMDEKTYEIVDDQEDELEPRQVYKNDLER